MSNPSGSVADAEATTQRSARKISGREWFFLIVYALSYAGVYIALLTPAFTTLAIRLGELFPDSKEATLGLVVALGGVAALIANPIAGALSDRTRSRFGMRRPWIVGGLVVGSASVVLIAFVNQVWMICGLWMLAQAAFNAALASLQALLPDQVAPEHRGRASAMLGISAAVGPFIGIALLNVLVAMGATTTAFFIAPTIIGAVVGLSVLLGLRDRVLAPDAKVVPWGEFLKRFIINPRKAADFSWVWLSRLVLVTGLNFWGSYQLYYMTDHLGMPVEQALGLQLTIGLGQSACIVLSSYTGGWLSDRLGRRKLIVYIAAGIVVTGVLLLALANSLPLLIAGVMVLGIGTGAFVSVDLALATQVLPNPDDAAKDLGLLNIANVLPQSIAPAIAPFLLAIGTGGKNYLALFIGAAIFVIVGALLLVPVRKVR